MTLTAAQNATLKAHIIATPALEDIWTVSPNEDGAAAIASLLNLQASPDYTVWKSMVTLNEMADAFDGGEYESLTTAETGRMESFASYSPNGINPSMADKRALYNDTFNGAGGAITRANLDILWKRLATEIEKLFATNTGDGSTGDPDVMDFEGNITRQEVFTARTS